MGHTRLLHKNTFVINIWYTHTLENLCLENYWIITLLMLQDVWVFWNFRGLRLTKKSKPFFFQLWNDNFMTFFIKFIIFIQYYIIFTCTQLLNRTFITVKLCYFANLCQFFKASLLFTASPVLVSMQFYVRAIKVYDTLK